MVALGGGGLFLMREVPLYDGPLGRCGSMYPLGTCTNNSLLGNRGLLLVAQGGYARPLGCRALVFGRPLPSGKGTLQRFKVVLPENHCHILVLTVLYVPNSLDSGPVPTLPE